MFTWIFSKSLDNIFEGHSNGSSPKAEQRQYSQIARHHTQPSFMVGGFLWILLYLVFVQRKEAAERKALEEEEKEIRRAQRRRQRK